jgi:hypothetical protein
VTHDKGKNTVLGKEMVTKILELLWHMPVIPATPEAETKKITSSRPIWMTQ